MVGFIADGIALNKKWARVHLKAHNPNAIAGICGLHMINRVIDVMSKEVDTFMKVVAFCTALYNLLL